ncbi:MAG TPA: hypothetical protein VF889_07515 [Bacteroidota bacterium]
MRRRTMWLCCMLLLAVPLFAQNGEVLRQRFSELVLSAKDEPTPQAKRERIENVLQRMSEAVAVAEQSPAATNHDKASLEAFRHAVNEKQDQLQGRNGYTRVQDKDLNAFAEYTVQDFEQAGEWVYISTLGLVLLVVLLVLLLR